MSSDSSSRRTELLEKAIRLRRAAAAGAPELPPRPAGTSAEMHALQRGLWLAHRLQPSSAAYNLASAFRVHPPPDAERLQRAFDILVARHRILRSTFEARRDRVEQVVHPAVPVAVESLAATRSDSLETAMREARRPFDLGSAPLIRLLSIAETDGDGALLVLVLHHILADEASLEILWRELGEAYDDRLEQTEPPIQYDDYVHWLRQQDATDRRRQLAALSERLDPLPDDLSLPFERPAIDGEVPRGRLLRQRLEPRVRDGLRRLAAATSTSPFMVSALAFRLLLQRTAPGQRSAFATPVSTRAHAATRAMIGYFLNPVIVAAEVDETLTIERAIRDFGHELRQALATATVPFQELAETLTLPRERHRHPVFQTMFVHQQTTPAPRLGTLALEPVVLDLGESKFDLSLFVTEGADRTEIAVEYRVDRFDEVWMRQLLDHFGTLLANLPGDLDRRVSQVSMLPAAEAEWLRQQSAGPPLADPQPTLLPQRILDRAEASTRAAALVCSGIRRSYGELALSARATAGRLLREGVAPGDRVGIFLARSIEMVEAIVGCHLAGAAYVPLDPGYPASRNRAVLDDAQVAAVLTTRNLRDSLPAGDWKTVQLDAETPVEPRGTELPALDPRTAAYLLYTSGSTGRPKGVVVSHDNLRVSTAARRQVYETPPQRFLLLPSIAFDSSVAGLFWTLDTGGTLVLPTEDEARDPRLLADLIQREQVTALLCVPSLYGQILSAGQGLLESLETAIVAGESCPPQLVEEHFRTLPATRLYNEYGPTEATVWATVQELGPDETRQPVSIGRPIPAVTVNLVDPLGRPVPAGIPGDAWVGGATVAQGYWRRPDLTQERFGPGPASPGRSYRTGDRMKRTADGRLLFLGRDDEQIKLRGFRIEAGDVEAALLANPEVTAVAVVSHSPEAAADGGAWSATPQLVAFVETRTAEELVDWRQDLTTVLPDFMIPARVVRLTQLPRLPNGKVDRRRLQRWTLDPVTPSQAPRQVADSRTQMLLSLWEGLLGLTGLGPDDNFFELGGHSLLVVEMSLAIERDLGVSLTAADIFESPTVRQLARRIEQRGGPQSPTYEHLFPIQPSGRQAPLIVAIPHFFSGMFARRFRGERPVYGLRGIGLRAEGNLGRWPTLEALGQDLVDEMQLRFPDSPFHLAGYSFGASMAFEAARILEERGAPALGLYLIAPMPEDFFRLGPFRLQIDALRQPVSELSTGEALRAYLRSNLPWTRRPYQRVWRWLAVEPWRRLLCGIGRLRRMIGRPLTPRLLHADVRVDRFRLHADYRPRPIRTPTVVFNARETATDAAATWRPFFSGPFTVVPTPDPHLDDTSVEAAKEVILRHLEDLEDPLDPA